MKKYLLPFVVLFLLIQSCTTQKTISATDKNAARTTNDTVRIANNALEYEVIIIDPGFNSWLATSARPREFYSQSYLESRNRVWVAEWNNRAAQPFRYSPNLYEMPIDYRSGIDYGYEVNYMLFNYLTYFQIKNKIRLGGFVPRN